MARETKEQKEHRLQLERAAERFRLHMEWQEFAARYHEGLLALMMSYKFARIIPKDGIQVELAKILAPDNSYNLRFFEIGDGGQLNKLASLPTVLPDDRDEDILLDFQYVKAALDNYRERCRVYDETQAKISAAKAKLTPEEIILLGLM